MPTKDFETIDALFSQICEKENKSGFISLNDMEKTVSRIWHASGVIENGGFHYFYEQSLDAESAAQAFDRIGCNRCAEILRLSLSLFPDSLNKKNDNDLLAFLETKKEAFYNLSCLFWDADKMTEATLAQYIDSFRSSS